MEGSEKQGKVRPRDTGLLACFRAPRLKPQAPSSPDMGSLSSWKEDFFSSSDDPDLVDPLLTTADSTAFKTTNCTKPSGLSDTEATTEESFVFSLPALSDALLEYPSFTTLSDPLLSTFSYNSGVHVETSIRGSLNPKPQPLRPPPRSKAISRLLSAPKDSELRHNSGMFVSTSCAGTTTTTSRKESEVGSWSIRRGRAAAPFFGVPLPSPSVATKLLPGLESYDFEDLLQGSREFSPECCMEKGAFGAVYRTWVQGASDGKLGRHMAVVRLNVNENQTWKDWKSDVQMLAQLSDSNICLIKGYCAHEDVDVHSVKVVSERLLVFEQSPNGTLHDYLCGIRSKTHMDWSRRISIVLGAARGLMYLHHRAPLQIVFREFKGSSVLLDKDFTPRLAGYGFVVTSPSIDRKSPLSSVMKTSQAYAKSNVWSFGVLLVELLTGKSSLDANFQSSDKNFVRWAKPFLKDEFKLALILDPRLKMSKCPMKGAAYKLAELALRCLKTKALQRPTMSRVVLALKSIREEDFGGRPLCNSSTLASLELQQQQQRRSSFGSLSFLELQQISKAGDILAFSMDGRPSVSISSEDMLKVRESNLAHSEDMLVVGEFDLARLIS